MCFFVKKTKRIAISAMALVLAVAGLAGCSEKKTGTNEKMFVKWWSPLYPPVAQTASNYSETVLYQELAKRSGVEIEFIHPSIGQEKENFNIMLASGDLPDLIQYDFAAYKGGVTKAIDDGVIISLNDHMDKAVNYKKVLEEHPDWKRQVMTDDGTIYCFASLNGDEKGLCWQGLQIRKDLLDKAGLPLPETIEEWDKALRAFKDMGIQYPLTLTGTNHNSAFSGAFGIGERFYQENGVVKHGVCEPGFKEYIEFFKGWYADGLLDPDYFAQDGKTFDSKITSGKAAAYFAPAGGGMGRYLPVLQNTNPEYDLAGCKFPVMNKGDIPRFGVKSFEFTPNLSVHISAQCKNPDAAIKVLDYGFSEDGHMLYNFGVEGVSYNMENGYPKYTDEVLKNPEGLNVLHAMAKYVASVYGGPFVTDDRYYEQYASMPQQREAVSNWSVQDDAQRIPNVSFNEAETDVIASKQTAVNSFISENLLGFITGKKSMDEYESFTKEVREMGLDDIIAVYQSALDRYNAR